MVVFVAHITSSGRFDVAKPYAGLFVLPVLLIGFVNGYASQITNWWVMSSEEFQATLPISLADLFILAVAGRELLSVIHTERDVTFLEWGAALGIMIPSSACSWATIVFYGTSKAIRLQGMLRVVFLFFTAVAAVNIWETVCLKWVSLPFAKLDATVTTAILSLFYDGAFHEGNVVSIGGDHAIVLLAGCTTAFILPKLLVLQAATLVYCSIRDRRLILWAFAITTVVAMISNILRLTVMASSKGLYDALHSPIGFGIFDMVLIGVVITATRIMDDRQCVA